MSRVESFPPVVGKNPRVLILGSMPGVESLRQQQYYAHPRNVFWPILAVLLNVDWEDDYDSRIQQFQQYPLVLWDVLQSCVRPGSLDASIDKRSVVANDLAGLLVKHPYIDCIVFNGGAAEQLFKRHVRHSIEQLDCYELIRLPSTSPAHASLSRQQKIQQWQKILPYIQPVDS